MNGGITNNTSGFNMMGSFESKNIKMVPPIPKVP